MQATEAVQRLETLLLDRGVPVSGGVVHTEDPRVVWQAFCAMALEPANTPFLRHGRELTVPDDVDSDLLLFEAGPYVSQPGLTKFGVSFHRQFTFEDDAGYSGMYAVSAGVRFGGHSAATRADEQLWGYAGPPRATVSNTTHGEVANWAGHVLTWAAQIERMASFSAFHELRLLGLSIDASDI